MISRILVGIVFFCALGMVYKGKVSEYGDLVMWSKAADIVAAILLFISSIIWIGADYYTHRIEMPQRLIYYRRMVEETKDLIGSEPRLNMKDMQMGKELTKRISDYQEIQMIIEIAKKSPFVMFKPQ